MTTTRQSDESPTMAMLMERRTTILSAAARHGASNLRVYGSVARGEAQSARGGRSPSMAGACDRSPRCKGFFRQRVRGTQSWNATRSQLRGHGSSFRQPLGSRHDCAPYRGLAVIRSDCQIPRCQRCAIWLGIVSDLRDRECISLQ